MSFQFESLESRQLFSHAGHLDPTFGHGGITPVQIGSTTYSPSGEPVIEADGKIVIAADTSLLRYNSNGSLDNTFGNGGVMTIKLSSGLQSYSFAKLQPDGKILLALDQRLYRVTSSGKIDKTFGGGAGYAHFSENITSVVVRPDGKILVATQNRVVRLYSNGTRDSFFGYRGEFVPSKFTSFDSIRAMLRMPDGEIVLMGNFPTFIRINGGGHIDKSFGGGDGHVEFDPEGNATSAALAPDGSLYAISNPPEEAASQYLYHITSAGLIDPKVNGVMVELEHPDPPSAQGIHPLEQSPSVIWSMQVDSQGRIILAGQTFDSSGNAVLAVARLHSDGVFDQNFGIFGSTYISINPDAQDGIGYAALGPNQQIYVSGWAGEGGEDGSIARLTL